MRQREITGSLFWLAAGLLLFGWSATYPLGSFSQPGTGFLPFGLGILLIIFSVSLLVRTLKSKRARGEQGSVFPPRWLSLAATVILMVAAVFLFEKLGYLIVFFALALLLPMLAGQITWRRSFVFAILSTAGVYTIFVWLLKQPLPAGLIGR